MKNIDKYIKELNLAYTNTVKEQDFLAVDRNVLDEEVEYKYSISLGYYINMFNSLYNAFRKDYESIEHLEVGEKVVFLNFSKWIADANYRYLEFYVVKPNIINKGSTLLNIVEANGELRTSVTNGLNMFDKNYYLKDVQLDENVCRQYLDLFEKYKLFLELYGYARNSAMFGDGVRYIYTQVDSTKKELIDGLKTFQIAFGIDYYHNTLYAKLIFNLGENLELDYEKSELIVDDVDKIQDKKLIDKLLNEVYINQEYLRERKRQ